MKPTSMKRTQDLKDFLQNKSDSPKPNENLKNTRSDNQGLCHTIKTPSSKANKNNREIVKGDAKPKQLAQSIELFHRLIDKEILKSANILGIDEVELQAWIDLQFEMPAKTVLNLLRSIQKLHLDPLNEEIGFIQHEDGFWQVFITIEGCAKLLNQHTQFNGLTFSQSDTLVDGSPEWIECSIYRKDRVVPITVREHFIEVRGENEPWKKMPRRMLRHRALQQCVRLAF